MPRAGERGHGECGDRDRTASVDMETVGAEDDASEIPEPLSERAG